MARCVAPKEAYRARGLRPEQAALESPLAQDGKQRSRGFASEAEAIAFDNQRHASLDAQTTPQPVPGAAGDAIYAYDPEHARGELVVPGPLCGGRELLEQSLTDPSPAR